METYVITLSQFFPVTHVNAGEETGFRDKFLSAIKHVDGEWWKLHTIRANFELWKKRFEKIAQGKACLSIRQWTGKPYRSKQVEISRLTREDGIGIQRLTFVGRDSIHPVFVDGKAYSSHAISHNDGLSYGDWRDWFSRYNIDNPLAIIHFTSFRY